MDEYQCLWCSRSFYLKDGHFCFLEEKPDNEHSESFLDELEKLAESLETATRNQDCKSDDLRHSSPKTQGNDTQLNSSLHSDSNFLTRNIFRGEQVTSSHATSFITQCDGSSLDVSRSDYHVSAQQSIFEASEKSPENSLFVPDELSQGEICRTDDNNSNPSENLSSEKESWRCNLIPVQQIKRKNTSFGTDARTCKKKKNRPSQLILGTKRSYLDSIWASPTCIEREGNKAEAQETKDYSKIKSISAKVTQIDNSSSTEIATNSVAVGSDADSEAVSVAGPSGIHTQSHITGKEKRFVCDVCGKGFSTKGNLGTHYRIHRGEKPFVCDICGKGFTQQGNFDRHSRTHTGEKPFVCDICGKGFTQQGNFDRHSRTHTGEKPFVCDICGKGFTQQGNFDRHSRTHTGEKPFVCDICGKRFTQQGNFDRHSRTHTGEKPFVCDICGKRFTRKVNLGTHYRTHTGEKPYACDVRGKGYSDRSNLQKHVLTHEGGMRFKCRVCGETFISNDYRNRHYKEKHQ